MRSVAGALALAAAASALLWLGVATRPYNPTLERERPRTVYDFFDYYRPNASWAFARLAGGELPLWNPHQGVGEPFLATLQTGVLYPPNALHAWLPTQSAFVVLAALHLALAAVLAGAWSRALGAPALGCAAAGLLYASSLQLWSGVWAPPTLYAAAWAPGVLLAVDRVASRPSARWAAALAGTLAMQILCGWPYAVAMTALAAAVYGGLVLAARGWRERRLPLAAALALALGAAAGAGLAAPQLLPTVELLGRSPRAHGTLEDATRIGPDSLHDPRAFAAGLLERGVDDGVPGFGGLALALLAVALAGPGRGRAAALLALAGLALLASFANHTPVYGWLLELPGLGDFRFPFRYRLITLLALCVTAGLGVGRLARRGGRAGPALGATCALAAVLAQVWPVASLNAGPGAAFPRRTTAGPRPDDALVALLREPDRRAWRSHWWAFGEDKVGEREGLLVSHDLEPLSVGLVARLLSFVATGDAGAEPGRPEQLRPTLGAPYWGYVPVPEGAERARLFDLVSVRFLVFRRRPPSWIARTLPRVADTGSLRVYENPAALPRAYRVPRGESEPGDPQRALERLLDPSFDPRRTALVDPLPDALAARTGPPPQPSGETHIEVDEPERLVVRTAGEEAALLVVSDPFYPGWEATLDGASVPILRANTALRAVLVPAGEHRVEMRYRPGSLRQGFALAALAAAGIAAALLREARRPGR
jgi:Bacterial membrane protein YfhO